jgi:hypothetical protein
MVTVPMQHEGKEVSMIMTMTLAQQGQQHPSNVGDSISATRAMTPLWQWQKTPAHQQWQWHHHDKGNNTSLTMATMPLQPGQQCYRNNGKNAWTVRMPAHWQRQHHRDKGNNASLTTAKMPVHQ